MNIISTTSTQATMFYDGACPLCRREVTHYQRLDNDKQVDWIDISVKPETLNDHGIDYDTAMSRLHALDKDGNIHSGVKAFLIIWSALPYYRWLAVAIRFTRVTPVLEWAYVRFARWRISRQGHCGCKAGEKTETLCSQSTAGEKKDA